MLQQTKNLAQKLRLSGFAENIERRCAEFNSGNLSPHELLSLLLSDEDITRNFQFLHYLDL